MGIWKIQWKIQKMFRGFQIVAFKQGAGISLNSDKNTFYRQSTYYQTVLRFHIYLKEIFSNSISLDIMENYEKRAAVLIKAVFLTHQHVDSWKVF